MNNPTQSSWEQAMLSKMTNNGERLAVLENKLNSIEKSMTDIQTTNQKIESLLGWLRWIGGAVVAIALSLIANFVYSLVA
ncbi:MAG: hypothetical protein ACFCAD_23840 [Pleurocapsa sp.]